MFGCLFFFFSSEDISRELGLEAKVCPAQMTIDQSMSFDLKLHWRGSSILLAAPGALVSLTYCQVLNYSFPSSDAVANCN